jgi:GNAT superfamily N-acetyltransferase
MSWTVREATDDQAEFEAIAAIVTAVRPESPTSVEEMRWQDANWPGRRFVAEQDGRIVGTATTGRIYAFPEAFERYWLGIDVLPDHRRQGIGSALLAAVSAHAREMGKTGLETSLSEIRTDGLAFLGHRGFEEIERAKSVRLELTGLAAPEVRAPDGIELTTLAARPDLVTGVHAVAELAFPDIPSADEPMVAGSLEEFRKRDVDRPGIPPDAFMVALDAATGETVGYASLLYMPGRTDIAWHDMTAVRPSHRGRGIAIALKQATIRWAIEAGLTALDTGNDVENAPMRAVNARLGYTPLPDELMLKGPLVDGPVAP